MIGLGRSWQPGDTEGSTDNATELSLQELLPLSLMYPVSEVVLEGLGIAPDRREEILGIYASVFHCLLAPLPPPGMSPRPPCGLGVGELLFLPPLWVGVGWVNSFRYAAAGLVEHRGAAK